MQYNFDEILTRTDTDCVKYDVCEDVFGTPDVLPMWVADMDFATPSFIMEALKQRLEHPILGYSIRSEVYFNSLINWLKNRHNWQVEQSWISFSPGIVPAINMAIDAFSEPGDGIILQSPVYFPFFDAIRNNGCTIIDNPLILDDNKYKIDFSHLEKVLPKARIMLLSNPHNPGGRVWSKQELEKVANMCINHNVLLFADEIHGDLVFKPHVYTPTASISEDIANQTITFIAPSKTFNIAGLGTSSVIIPNGKLKDLYEKALDKVHVGMGNVMGNVASQAAYEQGAEWLDQLLLYINANVEYMERYLTDHLPMLKMMKPEGTYLVWVDFRALDLSDDDLNTFLIREAKLGLNRGSTFGENGKGFMRFNLACPRSTLEKALGQLHKAITHKQ